jgi:leader peptidase (prepilin peptidase)/N-methyltransferase
VLVHVIYILFVFALGACVGSFLNVVVWRLPRGESLVSPPSHCPKCNTKLAWRDNIPVFGWIFLGGKCRYCREPISARYPIVEAVTGGLFVLYYVLFFIVQAGPCAAQPPMVLDLLGRLVPNPRPLSIFQDWPIYGLYMFLIACLLAASLIDAELFIIPIEIPWLAAAVGVVVHAIVDTPQTPGALNVGAASGALALGGGVGLLLSVAGWYWGIIPTSFPKGEPLLEIDREAVKQEIEAAAREGREAPELPPDYTTAGIRAEMAKEMLFLTPPLLLGGVWLAATMSIPAMGQWWAGLMDIHWLSGLLGAVLGGMVGAFVVWLTRILGTLVFGRVAMGLGDVHLMFGVGAVVGAGASTVAFFLAPFFGIALAVWMLLTGKRRELPYGPYLSLGTAFVLVAYCPIAEYLSPGLTALVQIVGGWMGLGVAAPV